MIYSFWTTTLPSSTAPISILGGAAQNTKFEIQKMYISITGNSTTAATMSIGIRNGGIPDGEVIPITSLTSPTTGNYTATYEIPNSNIQALALDPAEVISITAYDNLVSWEFYASVKVSKA